MTIPAYVDTQNLTIVRTRQSHQDGHTMELGATDREGDSVTVTKWTEDVGAMAVMPDTRLSVTYQQQGQDPDTHEVGSDEAYDLWSALSDAEQVDNLDNMTVGFILADLSRQGGGGGGAASLW